ncbi:MAG TPA: L-threonylcarbamoyladenylate synthase [Gemmatimonadaceae bacterium]|nr:L-threonylcarbamoyladenylate synthase [Gemmatimonadaceae bacterium]
MRVVRIAPEDPDPALLREAADLLRAGRLVAFPTETVYGLGAHALDAQAVQRIYDAKGRPSVNPLIVHVANVTAARALAAEWTPTADALARELWPGPLTLVVKKVAGIPDIVTAGHESVGVRVPAHPVALALLQTAALPVAAPSANLSTQVSPTTADHVRRGLGDRVDLILDGGPTSVGIESTVVDVTGDVPRVLRPGMISQADIARIAGAVTASGSASPTVERAPRSPGLTGRHYAPRARMHLFDARRRDDATAAARTLLAEGKRVGAMTFTPIGLALSVEYTMPRSPAAYARELYSTLHALDDAHCDLILLELPPDSIEWAAILDRVRRTTL